MRTRRWLLAALAFLVVAGGCTGGDAQRDVETEPAQAEAPPPQAWEEVRRRIAEAGGLTPQVALDWFATLFGPVPGAEPIDLPQPAMSGTQAVRYVLDQWDQLTDDQRRAVAEAIAVPAAGGGGGGTANSVMARGGLGPPLPQPHQESLERIVDDLESRTGHRLSLPVVAITEEESGPVRGPEDETVIAWAFPATRRAGIWEVDPDSPEAYAVAVIEGDFSENELRGVLAHEAFHALAWDAVGYDYYRGLPAWLVEGQAAWVGETVAAGTGLPSNWWQVYLAEQWPLYRRDYDAIGFYAHLENNGADVWSMLIPMLEAGGGGAMGLVLERAGTDWVPSWPSGLSRRSEWGAEWDTTGPGITGDARSLQDATVRPGEVATLAVPLVDQSIWNVAIEPDVDLLGVGAAGFGILRWSDGTTERFSGSMNSVYCLAERCTCEDGSDVPGLTGEPPPIDAGAFAVGLTDVRAGGGRMEIEGLSLEDACEEYSIGFPDGRWVGVAVGGGRIESVEAEAGADGVAVFEIEVAGGAVTDGHLVYSANASSVAQGESEGMADLVLVGDAPLGGSSLRVIAQGGTVHVEGTVTVESSGISVRTGISETFASEDEIGFSPQLATENCVRGDFAIEGRQVQEEAGYSSDMTAPFIAVRVEELAEEDQRRLDRLMGRVERADAPVVVTSLIGEGERLDTGLRATGACL
jgi:hypothetical protein